MGSDLLIIDNLKTYFKTSGGVVRAVDGVSLKVRRKRAVALVGESGSGKTTLALSIIKLVPDPGKIEEGQILFNGKDLTSISEKEMMQIRGSKIAMVFQDPSTYLNPVLKIGDQIGEILHSRDKEDVRKKVFEVLREVRISSPEKIVNSYPHQLSGGMKQRVVIATAFLATPQLLIADEPTTALDVTIQAQILDLMDALTEKFQTALLLVTHDIGIVADICEEVCVMYAGKVAEHGTVMSIFGEPQHPYTKGLMKAAWSKEEKKELIGIDGFVPNLINPPSGCRFHPRCEKAMQICRKEEPPLVKIDPEHHVYCWLYK
jgi:oligopeptide/dipeptide ABC transporter ATP-binding protein